MGRRLLHVLIRQSAVAVCIAAGLASASPAHAEVIVSVGMTLQANGDACTAGFFGRDDEGRQYVVTAGHCSGHVGDIVYDSANDAVGQVVARVSDAPTATGPFGYTLIWLAQGVSIGDRFFDGVGSAGVGDRVHVYGTRTGVTNGAVTAATANPAQPALESSAVVLRGDSGGPWYTDGPLLVAISVGYEVAVPSGNFLFSYAMPIGPLVALIQQTAGDWGNTFEVLTY